MGFLSRTLGFAGQGGAIIILQEYQVWGGFTSAALGLWLVRPVRKGFIIRRIGGTMFFPGLCPGVLSQSLKPCWKAVKSDLLGLTSGGWGLNPHGHLKKVRALWTSSGISLPVGVPPHLLFISHCFPRITWRLVSFQSLELFLPLQKGDA